MNLKTIRIISTMEVDLRPREDSMHIKTSIRAINMKITMVSVDWQPSPKCNRPEREVSAAELSTLASLAPLTMETRKKYTNSKRSHRS